MADTATETTLENETVDTAEADQGQPEQETVVDQPETTDQPEQAADAADEPATDAADEPQTDEPDDPVRRLERENAEIKGQLNVLTQFLQSQGQQRKPAESQAAPRYKQVLREYMERQAPNSAAAQSAKEVEKFLDALMSDLEPRLMKAEQGLEHNQQHLMRAAAKAEETEAVQALKSEFDATDAEIKAAKEYATNEYKRAAQSGEWPGSYQQLFERSLFRQRHAAKRQAAVKDRVGERKRLEAQVRADPTAGARPSNSTGRIDFPPEALRSTQALEKYLRQQGLLVDG
jgi:iron-sulfur cluster repair protein YtfE (RIC family)